MFKKKTTVLLATLLLVLLILPTAFAAEVTQLSANEFYPGSIISWHPILGCQ